MAENKKCACCAGQTGAGARCPVCGGLSPAVEAGTVRSLLKKTVKLPRGAAFNICAAPDCEVSYFTAGKYWTVKHTTVPFDFKTGASIRYACYCNKLTYEETAKAVAGGAAAAWSDVVKAVKGKLNKCQCAEKNPFGVCCTSNSFGRAAKAATNRRKS